MLTNCVSKMETRFFGIFQKIVDRYMYSHVFLDILSFKFYTDQKKRATLSTLKL